MNKILFIFLLTAYGYIPAYAATGKFLSEGTGMEHNPSDSTNRRITAFQLFADKYFKAVKQRGTAFLSAHTIFPISNSSFDVLDRSLHGVKITQAIFFGKLHQLFPADYMKDIRSIGQYRVVQVPTGEEDIVVCYYDDGGVDSNLKWIFRKKNGQYYFSTYVAEAG